MAHTRRTPVGTTLPNLDPADPRNPPFVVVEATVKQNATNATLRTHTLTWVRAANMWFSIDPAGSDAYGRLRLSHDPHTRQGMVQALNACHEAVEGGVRVTFDRIGGYDAYASMAYGANVQFNRRWVARSARFHSRVSQLLSSTRPADPDLRSAIRGGRRFRANEYAAMRYMFSSAGIRSAVESVVDKANYRNERELVDELRDNWSRPVYRSATLLLLSNLRDDHSVCVDFCDCGHVEHSDDMYTTSGGTTYCQECGEEDLREVDGEWYHHDDLYYWECDGEYHLEPEPGDEDDEDDDDGSYLLEGWTASCSHLEHDTTFTPAPIGDFTMGIELEVEVKDTWSGSRHESLQDCNDYFNDRDRLGQYAMFKRDGSLSDSRGFEIVTAARRLNDHIRMFKGWEPSNLISWSALHCGMHVHLDSRAFTALSLGKFLMFYNDGRNADLIRRVAGRHPLRDETARSYAGSLDQSNVVNPAKVKKAAGTHRYRMVNLTNLTGPEQERLKQEAHRDSKGSYSTVEVRIFRGTLKKDRLLAQIEMAHASVMFCRVTSWGALSEAEFLKWVRANAGTYKNLAAFLNVAPPPKVDRRNCKNLPAGQLALI